MQDKVSQQRRFEQAAPPKQRIFMRIVGIHQGQRGRGLSNRKTLCSPEDRIGFSPSNPMGREILLVADAPEVMRALAHLRHH
jgi:hypothetical protein